MKSIKELTGQYQLSKTLRFELKPIGKTLQHIESKGIIAKDETLAKEAEVMKGLIDEYHKAFIAMCLSNIELKEDTLEEYVALAQKTHKDEKEDKTFDKIKGALRTQIVEEFKKGSTWGDLFKKELITKHLPEFVQDRDEKTKQIVEHFNRFNTYFTGFHENRKNMYSSEAKSTSIAYRLIDENLPRFNENIRSFALIVQSEIANNLPTLCQELGIDNVHQHFSLAYYTHTLTQESIELYNTILGGKTDADSNKIQGLNEYINLYNQQHPDARLPLLKPLYKMILSDRESLSWLPNNFNSDVEMIKAINQMCTDLHEVLFGESEDSLKTLLATLSCYDAEHIYIPNNLMLTDISQHMFGQYDVFTAAKKEAMRISTPKKTAEKKNESAFEERIDKLFKGIKSLSIAELNSLVCDTDKNIFDYFKAAGAYDRNGKQEIDIFTRINLAHTAAKDILEGKHGDINQSEHETKLIKDLLDAYKDVQHFIKPLLGDGSEVEKDYVFDAHINKVWNALDVVTPLYNKVRNWLTRKPYCTEKVKLNFENPQLLNGWPNANATSCAILRTNNSTYYLAILDSNHRNILDQIPVPNSNDENIEIMKYLQGGDMGKNIQNLMIKNGKVCKVNGRKEKQGQHVGENLRLEQEKMTYLPSHINRIRKSLSYSISSPTFNKQDLIEFIDFYKPLTCAYYSDYEFTFKDSSEYASFADFTNDVNAQAYQIQFKQISKKSLMQLVDEGKLYLFQIWNKDFSEFSKGTPNMHTLYWKMLFNERNLADVVYKLNGEAEMFYRRSSINPAHNTIHKAGYPIKNKNILNEKTNSNFDYDIVKNRRYTVDKFQFHVPITINFKSTGTPNVNNAVRNIICNGGIKHIIGIDRGERHLLYLTLIDLEGNIVKQMSLNEIVNEYNGQTMRTNYKDLLAQREGNRTEARRNWKKIDDIKDLKSGYLSQVVHVISQMMVEYNAIVVLEDLNMGFMRGRQKVERNVYEQFERALIDKLNYYVDKKADAYEPTGVLHGLQLTDKFKSFKDLGKQSGCLFYIPAWNTSKIDPVTGFVNMLDTRYENASKAALFFSKFHTIRYNEAKDWFEFAFDYNDFHKKLEGTQTRWTLCSYGERIRTFRNKDKNNQWDNEKVTLTAEFKKVLTQAGIDYKTANLKNAICQLSERCHLEPLMHLMKLMLQLRNSVTGSDKSEDDYLISPVADSNGVFYDSRSCANSLPKDADANGAYNIARKGLMALHQIEEAGDNYKIKLDINQKAWLKFAQSNR